MNSNIYGIMRRLEKLEKKQKPNSTHVIVVYLIKGVEKRKLMKLEDATAEVMKQSTQELFSCKNISESRIVNIECEESDGFFESLLEEPTATKEELKNIVEL